MPHSILPSHSEVELARTVRAVLSHQTPATSSFAFISDLHYYHQCPPIINSIAALGQLVHEVPVAFVAVGGDFVQNDTRDIVLSYYEELSALIRAEVTGVPIFPVKGNHDDNTIYDHNESPEPSHANTVYPVDEYTRLFQHNEGIVQVDPLHPHGLYYYYDLPATKIRAIFLNVIDIPYTLKENGSPRFLGQWEYSFSNEQLNWMAHTAMNFGDKPDGSDWSVVIFSHIPLEFSLTFGGDLAVNNAQAMLSLLRAYQAGTTYSDQSEGAFAYSLAVDFKSQGPMELIGCIYGHVHTDKVDVIQGITHIASHCARSGVGIGPTAVPLVDRTADETAWDVFTVDRQTRTMRVTRYGAGADRTIQY